MMVTRVFWLSNIASHQTECLLKSVILIYSEQNDLQNVMMKP